MTRRTKGTNGSSGLLEDRMYRGRVGDCSLLLLRVKLPPWISRLQKRETSSSPAAAGALGPELSAVAREDRRAGITWASLTLCSISSLDTGPSATATAKG